MRLPFTFLMFALISVSSLSAQNSFPLAATNPDPFQTANSDPFQTNDELWNRTTSASITERQVGPQSGEDNPFELKQAEPAPEGRPTISVDELRHPVSKKGQKLLEKAQGYADSGNHIKAIDALQLALNEPSAVPFAHDMLGLEYLRIRKLPDAVREFGEATASLPRFPAAHSNYGYVLCVSGQTERGLQEIQTALNLDDSFPRAHFLKGVLLLDLGARDHEAWENLEIAQKDIPSARLALALFYARHGQSVAAQQELKDFAGAVPATLTKVQNWLARATPSNVPPGAALGLWPSFTSQLSKR